MNTARNLGAAVLMAVCAAGCTVASREADPVAKGGVLDLSRWSFETQGPVSLRGEWVFRYGELLGPAILPAGREPGPPMITVPGAWNEVTQAGRPLPGEGFATQALRLTLPQGHRVLGIKFGEAYSAERLWINGRLVVERGRVGTAKASEVADVQGRVVVVGALEGTVDLVLETSNHFHFEGGPVHALLLGTHVQLQEQAATDARIDFFLIGCLVVMGLFYAFLSLTRPDGEIVLFALLTLLLALRTATVQWYIEALVPIGSEGQLRLDYLTFIILPLIFCALIGELFPADVPRVILRAALVYGAIALVGPLALDTRTFTSARNLNIAVASAYTGAALLFVARATFRGRKGATPLLLGCLLVLGVGLHDAAISLRLIPESRTLLPLASTVLVFAHGIVLGRRLTDALQASETLTHALQDANALLEHRIAERTLELERMAMTDPLTGLLNRRPLLSLAEAERARAARSKELVGVMMIDCDDFKRINDAHGHEAGDRVLSALGQRFSALVRSHDLLGRWGGEEFVMIFSTPDEAGAEVAAERVRHRVAETPFEVTPTLSLTLTVSVGVALLAPGEESFEELLRQADRALYAAKSAGKNQVSVAPQKGPGVAEPS